MIDALDWTDTGEAVSSVEDSIVGVSINLPLDTTCSSIVLPCGQHKDNRCSCAGNHLVYLITLSLY